MKETNTSNMCIYQASERKEEKMRTNHENDHS